MAVPRGLEKGHPCPTHARWRQVAVRLTAPFWKLRGAAPDPHNFPNLGLPRARLALIEDSKEVTVEGITFKDSQFWNLHLYRCENVLVRGARFEVPDDYKQAPSSDGIDLDSCRRVTIDGCTFSVTDDCIAAKGSKGPRAREDKDSPPVENIRVRNCHFRRGHHVLACGSDATIVRDVIVENSRGDGRHGARHVQAAVRHAANL